jgi:thioredoxin-like negative regulator of GroEL
MRPIIDQLREEGYSIQIIEINKEKELTKQYEITALPTTIILVDNKEKARIVGQISIEDLRRKLKVADYKLW